MIQILSFVLPFGWLLLFMFVKLPVAMVIFGGIITSVILLLIIYVAIQYRFRYTPTEFRPSKLYDVALGLSMLVIICVAVYGLVKLI